MFSNNFLAKLFLSRKSHSHSQKPLPLTPRARQNKLRRYVSTVCFRIIHCLTYSIQEEPQSQSIASTTDIKRKTKQTTTLCFNSMFSNNFLAKLFLSRKSHSHSQKPLPLTPRARQNKLRRYVSTVCFRIICCQTYSIQEEPQSQSIASTTDTKRKTKQTAYDALFRQYVFE